MIESDPLFIANCVAQIEYHVSYCARNILRVQHKLSVWSRATMHRPSQACFLTWAIARQYLTPRPWGNLSPAPCLWPCFDELLALEVSLRTRLFFYRGLGVERMLLSLIRMYCEPTFLVLVLNTNAEEEVCKLTSSSLF